MDYVKPNFSRDQALTFVIDRLVELSREAQPHLDAYWRASEALDDATGGSILNLTDAEFSERNPEIGAALQAVAVPSREIFKLGCALLVHGGNDALRDAIGLVHEEVFGDDSEVRSEVVEDVFSRMIFNLDRTPGNNPPHALS